MESIKNPVNDSVPKPLKQMGLNNNDLDKNDFKKFPSSNVQSKSLVHKRLGLSPQSTINIDKFTDYLKKNKFDNRDIKPLIKNLQGTPLSKLANKHNNVKWSFENMLEILNEDQHIKNFGKFVENPAKTKMLEERKRIMNQMGLTENDIDLASLRKENEIKNNEYFRNMVDEYRKNNG